MNPIQVIDGKYQIVRQLGEGGMGAVYEARHLGTGRRVAVKVIVSEALMKSTDMVARFQREARAAGSIESQHIAHILDTGFDRENGYPYMVMEYLSGEDVSQAIERNGPLHPDLALRVVGQACIGLQRAHDAGVTHRDIKPANLYLAQQDGGDVLVKLLDFGIAKVKIEQLTSAENAALTRTGSMLGSPLYMSPEQAKGAKTADHRTDVWSLGVVLYEALSGVTPHGHCDTLGGLILAICSEEPRVVQEHAPWVAPEVASVVHRALTIDVNRRFQSAAEMGAAIRALLPHGMAIQTGMFAPLPPNMRGLVAPRLATTAPALGISGPNLPAGAVTGQGNITGAGLAQSHALPPKRSGVVPAILATLVVVGGGGFGAYHFLVAKKHPPEQTIAATVAAPPSASATGPAPSAAPDPPRTVRLAIVAPPDAKVEIDDASATLSDGGVDVTGALGSTHHVKLTRGKLTTLADIAITNDGAIPSRLELGVTPPAPGKAGGGPAAAVPPKPGAPPQGGGAPPTPPPATPKPAQPTQPQVSRDFN